MKRSRLAETVLVTLLALVATVLGAGATATAAVKPHRYEQQVVRHVNAHRDAPGLADVRTARCADRVAERWVRRVHRGRPLPRPSVVARRCGGGAHAVAVARKRTRPAGLVRTMARTRRGHRVLDNRHVRRIGVGALVDRRGRWSVVVVLTGRKRVGSTRLELSEEAARYVAEIRAATDAERVRHGLEPFAASACAEGFAQDHSDWMARTGTFEHAEISGMFGLCGTSHVGENIAYTHRTGGEYVVDLWMDSPGHRANILNPSFTHLGIGVTHDPGTGRWYSTQDFTNGPA